MYLSPIYCHDCSIQFRYGTYWEPVRGSAIGTLTTVTLSGDEYIDHISGAAGDILDGINIITQHGYIHYTGPGNFDDSDRSILLYMKGQYCSNWFGSKVICGVSFTYLF